MQATNSHLPQILHLAPEWQAIRRQLDQSGLTTGGAVVDLGKAAQEVYSLFQAVGAKSLYAKLLTLGADGEPLMQPVRDCYLLSLTAKMLRGNPTLRRFAQDKRMTVDEGKSQQMSMAVELSVKLEAALRKQLGEKNADGFKILLPAYVQSSVNNAVIDYIKNETHWERQTLPNSYDDGDEESPIEKAPDDLSYAPEQVILSKEKVHYLNALRKQLEQLISSSPEEDLSLTVVDCLFGLGLTKHSVVGEEMTMRECSERLKLEGETQARKIARCQVLLDKGLDSIRQLLRDQMPALVECWRQEINVNSASRRDLNHQLDLTEGEIERLIVNRQYLQLEQLVERLVIKTEKLPLLAKKGAVAAFVPVDLNSATIRDLMDILGLAKDVARKIMTMRPLSRLEQLVEVNLVKSESLAKLTGRGAVLKLRSSTDARLDLNQAAQTDLIKCGLAVEKASLISRALPFETWAELEEFLPCDEVTWTILRNNFRLGLKPA